MRKGYISTKPMKQWCKARGLDFAKHMDQYPLARMRMFISQAAYLPKAASAGFWIRLWQRIVSFFRPKNRPLAISG